MYVYVYVFIYVNMYLSMNVFSHVCMYVCIYVGMYAYMQAPNLVLCTTEKNSNMRKALKVKILETVSTHRALFVKIKASGERKTSEINNLTKHVVKLETEPKQCKWKERRCIIRHLPQEQQH